MCVRVCVCVFVCAVVVVVVVVVIVMCMDSGVRSSLLKAVYLVREGESLFRDSIKWSSFGKGNLKQLVEERRRQM